MKTCSYRQLCAVASDLLQRHPSLLTNSTEWKEAIKDRVTALGYPRPFSREVTKVMDAVEHVHRRRRAMSDLK
jgi:hypothetical protein